MVNLKYTLLQSLGGLIGFKRILVRPAEAKEGNSSVYSLQFRTAEGKPFEMESCRGKKVLLVNVASRCGFTPQYRELEEFATRYQDKIMVIGFPCNDFKSQEPGTEEDILSFCRSRLGAQFTISQKIQVKKAPVHPVYRWLSDPEQNGWNSQAPFWNFCKYLISEEGKLLAFFGPAVSPFHHKLLALV